MRSGFVLAFISTACGGYGIPTTPGRMNVRLVSCRPALPPPSTAAIAVADTDVYGGLIGTEAPGGGGGPIGRISVGRAHSKPGKRATVVTLGKPALVGSLAAAAVTRALQNRLPELQACASKEVQTLAASPGPYRAAVQWRFTIGATGKIIQADATSQVLNASLSTCITSVVKNTTFPAPPDGRVVAVTYPIVFDSTGNPPEEPMPSEATTPWTPFALDTAAQVDPTGNLSRATEGAVRGKLGAIEACFAGSTLTGSLRAMLELDVNGGITSVRVGGLGDKSLEACVENAVTGLHVVTPTQEAREVACDLSRGDARPWRVTADRDGYGVVAASRARLLYKEQTLAAGETEPDTLVDHTMYLIVAEPDTPGAMLKLAMTWTQDADATLIAVRTNPKDPKEPPQFLGMGRTSASTSYDTDADDPGRPSLKVDATNVTACVNRATQVAKLGDASAVGGLIQKMAAKCRTLRCTTALMIAIDKDAIAKDLIEVIGAARRAGFDRVLLGGDAGCQPVKDDAT